MSQPSLAVADGSYGDADDGDGRSRGPADRMDGKGKR